MAATRKTTGRKVGATKARGGITKAKVKRVARQAQAALEVAAHDAELALRRTALKLKRTAEKLETKMVEARGPAKRRARRIERKVASALESARESITTAARRGSGVSMPLRKRSPKRRLRRSPRSRSAQRGSPLFGARRFHERFWLHRVSHLACVLEPSTSCFERRATTKKAGLFFTPTDRTAERP